MGGRGVGDFGRGRDGGRREEEERGEDVTCSSQCFLLLLLSFSSFFRRSKLSFSSFFFFFFLLFSIRIVFEWEGAEEVPPEGGRGGERTGALEGEKTLNSGLADAKEGGRSPAASSFSSSQRWVGGWFLLVGVGDFPGHSAGDAASDVVNRLHHMLGEPTRAGQPPTLLFPYTQREVFIRRGKGFLYLPSCLLFFFSSSFLL